MLAGDLTTMALADVLQWLDATRTTGVLHLEREGEVVWIKVKERTVVAASPSPSRPVALQGQAREETEGVDRETLALEHLFDQFLAPEGAFRFRRGEEPFGDLVSLDVSLPELLMEGMRLLDEWPRLNALYDSDAQRLHPVEPAEAVHLSRLQQSVMSCARRELTLSESRMVLGLSRPALLRRVDELRVLGCVSVDGAPGEPDLMQRLIAQAKTLLHEKQFDEAAHVFSALLATDPTTKMLGQMLRQAEREQLLWLYEEIPPHSVPHLCRRDLDRRALTHADREVLERVNGRWDVSILVLTSPLRETETLKSLRKLVRLRAIELEG